MYVNVAHLHDLLATTPTSLKRLDHISLKPEKLNRKRAVHVDEIRGHVVLALSKKP
jgi:hypothetical protein